MAAHRNQAGAGSLTRALACLTVLITAAACAPSDGELERERTADAPSATPGGPSTAERDAILAPLQTLFDALEAGDAELLRSVVAPGTVMSYSETRDGSTTLGTATLDQLAERITTSPVPLIERMWDPVVTVDGPLATIWTPYDFYAGSELSHCGIDAATLLLGEDGWTIVGLSWTRDQPPACELHPDGPPAR